MSKVILGTDFSKNQSILEQAWKQNHQGQPNPSVLAKIMKYIKGIAALALGVAIGLVLMLFKRNKTHNLNMREQREK